MPKKSKDDPAVDSPSPTEDAIRPDHYYEFTQTSVSKREDGTRRVNQEVIFREYADSSQELTLKNMPHARKVAIAILDGCEELANAAGYPTQFPSEQPEALAPEALAPEAPTVLR